MSSKVYPYVYIITHRTTNQFYIGLRFANKWPAELDLGTHYFTSSRTVEKLGFENFETRIIAEFFDKSSAQEFEASLINENWNNPLILNKCIGGKRWSPGTHSADTRAKISAAHKGKTKSDATKQKMREASGLRKHSDETKMVLSEIGKEWTPAREQRRLRQIGRPLSEETKQKMREAHARRRVKTQSP